MSWNPDSGDPLASPAINVRRVEETSLALWNEFLSGWFDGSQHFLRGALANLPEIQKISFQEQNVQPDAGLYLHITLDRPAAALCRLWPNEQWVITEHAKVNFWFRSKVKDARPDGHNSRSLVRFGADTLFAILRSSILTEPLSRRGMSAFRPQPSVLISGGDVAMRLLALSVTYTYSNEESTMQTVPSIQSALPQNLVYVGAQKNFRVTASGLERLGKDGKWYLVDVDKLDTVPVIEVSEAPVQ